MDTNVAAYKDAFLAVAREDLNVMQNAINGMQNNTTDAKALEELFIRSHSLKGKSMTMGFTGIAKSALAIERYCRSVRDGEKQIDAVVFPEIVSAIQQITNSVNTIEKENKEAPLSQTITRLEQVLSVKV